MVPADRAAVIAEEQRAVDHAYDCIKQKRQSAQQLKGVHGSECTDAGLSFVPDVPPEFGTFDDLSNLPLVFMRVDIADDPDDRETWHVGRRSVFDTESNLVVVNWTTRAAVRWMKAQPSRPGEVRLRRKLRLDGHTVTDYLDDIRPPAADRKTAAKAGTATAKAGRAPAKASPSVPDSRSAPSAEDPLRPRSDQGPGERIAPFDSDAFLLADLDRARDGLMRDIVETIQREQLELVSDGRPGVLVVQGGPGTGKTAVGLHRVVWLLDPENGGLAPDDVLVVGPHREFLRYVSDVLPRLGSRGVATVEVSRLWRGEVRGEDTPQAHLVKSDERMAEVLRRVVESGIRHEAPAAHVGDDVFSTPYKGVALTVPVTEIETLATEARDSSGPYLTRRRRFIDTFVDRLLHRYAKALPGHRPDSTLRAGIEKQGRVASLINAVWPALNAETILRRTLNDADVVRVAAPGLLTAEERQAILRPRVARISQEPWTLDDLVLLEELRHLLSGEEPERYRHIVVDEAQDLTPMQARSLARRCPGGSMTVLGDLAQTTGARRYDVWERLARILSGHDGWHLAELTVGYRVPDAVMRFAAPLAAAVSSSTAVPMSVRPADEASLTIVPVGVGRLADEAVARAFALAAAGREQARSVALIVPDGTALLDEIGEKVAAAWENTPEAESDAPETQGDVSETRKDAPREGGPPVSVLAATMAKGLEFDHVVVVEPAAIADQGPAGPRRLYVAITRCTQSLTVTHSAPLPAELGGPADPVPVDAPEPTNEKTMTLESDVPSDNDRLDRTFQDFVSSLEERVRADRQCHVHEQVRYGLIAELHGVRLAPSQSSLVDIACKGPEGAALYEVLGEGGHTYEHMREAVLRMMEVEHVNGERAEHLFLVLPQAPQVSWAPELLFRAFNVMTIWRDGAGWEGRHVALALGRPPAAEPAPE
ncbi:HelD family protein [Streptosporangium canum]|uniref:HelD family protein n=1 Tax=Streptosporangium canum TaxID=324952 RepID=UPI00341AB356